MERDRINDHFLAPKFYLGLYRPCVAEKGKLILWARSFMLIVALGWQFQAFLAGFESFRSPLHRPVARVLGYNHWIRVPRCSTVISPSILRHGSGSTDSNESRSKRRETCGRTNEEQRVNRWTSPFLATTSSE